MLPILRRIKTYGAIAFVYKINNAECMKRLNQETGKPFKRGDTRDDGFIFVRYIIHRPVKENGYYVEDWTNPKRRKVGKKRLNPLTGKIFKRGDWNVSKNKQFFVYTVSSTDADGFCYENWVLPGAIRKKQNQQNASNKISRGVRKKDADLGLVKKRLNPKTGKFYTRGDKDKRGRIFLTYSFRDRTADGFMGEVWVNKKKFHLSKLSNTLIFAKERAEHYKVPFKITRDYLEKIFPENYVCPVFGIKMEWGGEKRDSPSLDRIIPELGYVKGNLAFISNKANVMKHKRTPEVLRKIANYIEESQGNKG